MINQTSARFPMKQLNMDNNRQQKVGSIIKESIKLKNDWIANDKASSKISSKINNKVLPNKTSKIIDDLKASL